MKESELAKQLAVKIRESAVDRHRLNEIESSRAVRLIRYAKMCTVNPTFPFKHPKQALDVFRKKSVSPLPKKFPTASEIINNSRLQSSLPNVESSSPLFRYPDLKLAVIGSVDGLNTVCHAYNIEDANWEYLLEAGTDALLINTVDTKDTPAIASKAVEEFSSRGLPIVYVVNSLDYSSDPLYKHATHAVLWSTMCNQIGSIDAKKTIANPVVDPLVYNPIDWPKIATLKKIRITTKNNSAKSNKMYIAPKRLHQQVPRLQKSEVVKYDLSDANNETEFAATFLTLLASGVIVDTKGSRAVRKLLPNYPFKTTANPVPKDSRKNIFDRERRSIFWRREVILNFSYLSLVESILQLINIPLRPTEKISVIHSTNRPTYLKHALDNIDRQTWPKNKIEVVLILHGDNSDFGDVGSIIKKYDFKIKILRRPSGSIFGENLNLAISKTTGRYITKMDDDDWYGPNHFYDLYSALIYSQANLVGKWGNFTYLSGRNTMCTYAAKNEESYVHQLPGATFMGVRQVFENVKFGHVSRAIDSDLNRRLIMRGGRCYSTHKYNFIRVRHGDHTYKADDEMFLANSDVKPWKGLDKETTFI